MRRGPSLREQIGIPSSSTACNYYTACATCATCTTWTVIYHKQRKPWIYVQERPETEPNPGKSSIPTKSKGKKKGANSQRSRRNPHWHLHGLHFPILIQTIMETRPASIKAVRIPAPALSRWVTGALGCNTLGLLPAFGLP
jgi:hypothetical protein